MRDALVRALEADLVGPFHPPERAGPTDEVLPLAPSRWYLTGFLAPERDRETRDPTAEDDFAGTEDEPEETAAPEPPPKQRHRFPASMGLSVLLPPGGPDRVLVTVRFATYTPELLETSDGKKKRVWRRLPQVEGPFDVPLDAAALREGVPVPSTPRVRVVGHLEAAEAPGLDPGARALSLFLVNRRVPNEKTSEQDTEFLFQVQMEVEYEGGFCARPNRRGEGGDEWDDQVADLQFRDRREHAVGHGVSVEVPRGEGPVTRVRTSWLPRCEVPRVRPADPPAGSTVDMETLRAARARGGGARALAAHRRGVRRVARRPGEGRGRQRRAARDAGAARQGGRASSRAHAERHRAARGRSARLRGVSADQPRHGRLGAPPQPRALRRGASATVAALPARVPPPERRRRGRPEARGPRERRADLLPHRRRQDGGVPRRDRVHAAAPPAARAEAARQRGSAWPCCSATRCACSRSISSAAPRR
ncbi:MAG: hypothetical protein M5U28_23290 [Sandaracinaceae bacterium]|nr:hypothetical protein [Sandaracinaceae bacterium]